MTIDKESLLQEARALITSASFSDEDRGMWYGAVSTMSIDGLGLFVSIMRDPALREATNDAFKAKYAVRDDPHAMQLIMQREREDLTTLLRATNAHAEIP